MIRTKIRLETNKEVTATFEDALFSVKSLAIMFGGEVKDNGANQEVLKTVTSTLTASETSGWSTVVNGTKLYIAADKATYFKYVDDKVKPVADPATTADFDFMTFDILDATTEEGAGTSVMAEGLTIRIDASKFGGTYYITGDTYARNYQSGKDEFLQFIIPKGKVSSEDLSLTMEADGDPATFTMNVNVLRAADGSMFKLVKYTLKGGDTSDKNKGVASVLKDYDEEGTENAGYESDATPVNGSKPTV